MANSNNQGNQNMQAITYPNNPDPPQIAPIQPRQPSSLQGLLRFATEATRSEDVSGREPILPMDEERKRFLEQAISYLTVDMTKEMKESIAILSDAGKISRISCDDELPEDVNGAFELLLDSVYNIDMSVGFYKLDGYSIFSVCFSCEHPTVRSTACQLLAELCQNNPFCQSRALECGFLNIVLDMLKTEHDESVLKTALYATSCLIREHEQCAKVFFMEGGSSVLARCIKKPIIQLRDKAAFLISCLYPQYPEMKHGIIGVVKDLISAITCNSDDRPDQILRALHAIISNSDPSMIREFGKSDLALKDTVDKFMEFADRNPEECYDEELDCCKSILDMVSFSQSISKNVSNEAAAEADVDR